MAQRIVLIDASPAMRETVSAILADEFDVTAVADDSQLGPAEEKPALAIVGMDRAPFGVPADTPILWLVSNPQWTPPTRPHSATISRFFIPPELRATVKRVIAGIRTGHFEPLAQSRLSCPFLSSDAALVAEHAVRTRLPVLIDGPRCTARGSVAHAIHAGGTSGPFVMMSTASLSADALARVDSGTVFVDRIERLRSEQQEVILAALQPDGTILGRSGEVRLIGGTECGIAGIQTNAEFSEELFYRINVLPLSLLPLRDRPQDIPLLAQLIGSRLARVLDVAVVSFTPRALERLTNYLWFGDIAELEAVLARTVALGRKELIDAEDLCFTPPAGGAVKPRLGGMAVADAAAVQSDALDLVINEIAHELKNPLSTIKTFAQHLRRLGPESGEEQQLARLTSDAVDEIDTTVENLVQFTHLAEPVREQVALPAVLAPAVATLTQLVRPRTRRVDYRPPPPVSICVDRSQVTYGLNNLFRALSRGLGDTGRIVIGYEDPGCIVIELPTGFDLAEAHLATLLAGARQLHAPASLAGGIAQRVLERNGGVLTFDTQQQPPRVTVRFPLSEVEEVPLGRNAQTPRASR